MSNVLLIDPNVTSQKTVAEVLVGHSVTGIHDADKAVHIAAEKTPDIVILEMSLSGHSGMEFLYEFRSYLDWLAIPVIVYSSVNISEEILSSRAWEKLKIHDYLYKPQSTLAALKSSVEKALSSQI